MDILNIFETIVLSSLVGSLIVLIILFIKKILKDKLNCTFHYYIWLILLIKLIIPFGPQTPLNLSNIYLKFYVESTLDENTQKTQINSAKKLKDINLDSSTSVITFQSSKENLTNYTYTPLNNKIHIRKILCFIWILGVILLSGILTVAYKRLRKIIKTSITNVQSAHKKILYNCMNAMNIKSKLELSYSSKITSPSLCGLIRPKILIPISIADTICDEEFKYILMHELSHFKNKDIIINWIISLLSIIYWFNPLLLYGFHKIRQDCEFSCDNQVISRLEEGENIKYGNTIIRILQLVGNSKRLVGTTLMVMNSSEIKRRIIMISKYKKINIKGILLGAIVISIIGGLSVAVNASKINSYKNISKAETSSVIDKSKALDSSDVTVPTTIKRLPADDIKPFAPFSADIVIYSSHADETYKSGLKITDVCALINERLVKEGLNSRFIQSKPPTEYVKSYQSTRDLITKNVQNYSSTILLDIHRNIPKNNKPNELLFTLSRKNPHYDKNIVFVNSLLKHIENSKQVKYNIVYYNFGTAYFNQDLSNNSVLIEIGNDESPDKDIENCVDALVSSLKNIK